MTYCSPRRADSYRQSRSRSGLRGVVLLLLLPAFAAAQPTAPERQSTADRPAFEQFVPPTAQIFIAISDFRELQTLLVTMRPERLVPLLAPIGAPSAPIDPKSILQTFLGPTCRLELEDLRTAQFAFAARSWSELADGILLLQLPDDETFDRWFPGGGGRAMRISPQARILRLENTTICTRANILAAGRSNESNALMRETIRLMAGRVSSALHTQSEYQRLLTYLPSRPLAIAYFNEPESSVGGPDAQTRAADVQPGDLRETLAGLYARDGRLELAMRSNRKSPQPRTPLQTSTLKKIERLPATTLTVWSAPISVMGLSDTPAEGAGTLARYLQTLRLLATANDDAPESFPSAGADLIMVWDEDARPGMTTPQIAIMLPCPDAREWDDRFRQAAQALLDRLAGFNPVAMEDAPSIQTAIYRDQPISYVDFSSFAAKSKFPAAKLLRNVQPSWAASGDWWYFALSRRHLERLIDSENTEEPGLGSQADFAAVLKADVRKNAIFLMRPASATAIFERWLADAQGGQRSLLNPGTWSGELVLRVIQPDRLGIGMHAQQEPGSVLVARVDPDTAADGLLEPGDRILGIDGRLLDLESPNMDLRTRWHSARTNQHRTMRVLRGGDLIDVTLEFETVPGGFPELPRNFSASSAEAARVGAQVSSLVFTELASDDQHFAALISVRLLPPSSDAPAEASAASAPDSADKSN